MKEYTIPEQKVKKEIEEYLRLPLLDVELDPLQWWKVHVVVLPIMAKLAQKYLCLCASSSASEQTFSYSGNIVSKTDAIKTRLSKHVGFLAKNLH